MSCCLNDKDSSSLENNRSIERTLGIMPMQVRYCEQDAIENTTWRKKEIEYLSEIEYLREQIQDIVKVCEDQYTHKEMALKYMIGQYDRSKHEAKACDDQKQVESTINSKNQLYDNNEISQQQNKLLTEAEAKETKEMKEFADQREELEKLTFRRIQLQENLDQEKDWCDNRMQDNVIDPLIKNKALQRHQQVDNNKIIYNISQVETDETSDKFVSPIQRRLREVDTTHTTAAGTVSSKNLSSSSKKQQEQQSIYFTTEFKKKQYDSAGCVGYESPQPIASNAFDSLQNKDASEQVLNIIFKLRNVMKLKAQLLSPVQKDKERIYAGKVFEQQFDSKMEELQWQITSQKERKPQEIVSTQMVLSQTYV